MRPGWGCGTWPRVPGSDGHPRAGRRWWCWRPDTPAIVMSFPDCPRSPGRRIIDTATGRRSDGFAIALRDREVRAAAIGQLGLSPVAITGDAGGALRLWGIDDAGHQPRAVPLTGHRGQVLTVVMCHVGARTFAVSGGEDGTVRVWDLLAHTGGEPLTGHAGPVTSIAVADVDGRAVVTSGGEDGTVRRWDLLTGVAVGRPLHGHAAAIRAVAAGILNSVPVAASAGDDGTVRLWDLRLGRQIGPALKGHDGPASAVVLVHTGHRTVVVSGGHDGTVRVWDGPSSRPAPVVFPWPINALQWTAPPGRLVVAYGSETATLTPRFDHL
jgi:WD40 repeat protein